MIRHFLDIGDLTTDNIYEILSYAESIKKDKNINKVMQGKQAALIFQKNSTRTRFSFEVGIDQLGGNAIYTNSQDTQLGRGESPAITARVLSNFVDLIVIRANKHQLLQDFVDNATVPIINALTDKSHPCQILADLLTCKENGIDFENDKILWLGDINNMSYSWVEAALLLNINFTIGTPKEYNNLIPTELKKRIEKSNKITITDNIKEAMEGAKVVMTDTWVSMGEDRDSIKVKTKINELHKFQINKDLMSMADKAIILHCLPAHEEEEITDEMLHSQASRIYQQAENRLHAQKALITYLFNGI